MKQKVWYIFDNTQRVEPEEKSEANEPLVPEVEPESRPSPAPAQKNPALAFSCSMLVWGSGQLYGGEFLPGTLFLGAMLLFYSPLLALLSSRQAASRWVSASPVPINFLLAGAMFYLFFGLFGWLGNAVDAYYRVRRLRSESFRGVDHIAWPLCGSLLFPGWGQFLNGQPRKGIFFLCWGGMGILAGVLVGFFPQVWPLLEAESAAFVLEVCLVSSLLLLVLALLLWIVSVYDALSICKKLLTVKWRGSRVRDSRGALGLMPRLNAILGLALAISLGQHWMPRDYYLNSLEKVRIEARSRQMELLPELLGRVIETIRR
jgi:TM2 domain-containing membrane protein YozV